MPFRISSRAFKEGESIPVHYTADGEDVSPPLEWQLIPEGTKSLALVCEDPDAHGGPFIHWVVFNIPPNTVTFPEAFPTLKSLPNGTTHGVNGFGGIGYRGPSPPPGGPHRYYFKIYALSAILDLEPGSTAAQLEKIILRRTLGKAETMGKYERK